MFLMALAAATATAQADAPLGTGAVRQATASVRIVSGERISETETPDTAIVTNAEIRDADGTSRAVRLIEFP